MTFPDDPAPGVRSPRWLLRAAQAVFVLMDHVLAAASRGVRRTAEDGELRTTPPALVPSEASMRMILEHVLDAIVIIDDAGRITYCNPATERIFGYARSEMMGANVAMLMPSPHREVHDRYIQAYRDGGVARIIGIGREVTGQRKDGSVFPLELGVTEMRFGSQRRFCGILRDVSERRRAREELERNERKLRSYIDLSLDAVLVLDGEGRFVEANPAAQDLLGYASTELAAKAFHEVLFVGADHDASGSEQLRLVMQQGRSHGELALRRKNGSRIIADMNAVALGDDRYLAVLRDVTERRAAEAALMRERALLEMRVQERTESLTRTNRVLQQEIGERVRVEHELRGAREEALQAAQAKAEFLANMSHEIRTPMNAVLGTAALLATTPLDGEQREYVDTIRFSSESLLDIINDILDFSKAEAGMLALERRPFDLLACIEQAIDIVAPKAAEKELDIAYFAATEVPRWIVGDVARLRQVLINLVSNAVKFTERGDIAVHVAVTTRHGDELELDFAVRDTGIGIAPERMHRLFRAFSQADSSTTRKYGGTGLGLAICARLVQFMGGRAWAESELGKGSVFHFTIRARPAADAAAPDAPLILRGKHLLIVDDSASQRAFLEEHCRRAGITTCCAASGEDALRMVQQRSDLHGAIIDFHLPDLDGLELARALRQRTGGEKLGLVLLRPGAARINALRPADELVDAQMAKPVKPRQLVQLVSTVLVKTPDRTGNEAPEQLDATLGTRVPLAIMLAEDSVMNQKLVVGVLRKLGYTPDVVATGREVLAALRRNLYDLVLMDLQMPEMDGLEAARRIVAEFPPERRPRIVAMTANALAGDRERCLEVGMDDYIAKPVLPLQMQRVIERWGKAAPASSSGAGHLLDMRVVDELRALAGPEQSSLLESLLREYIVSAPQSITAIRRAMADADGVMVATCAHKLAGMSCSIGATTVSDICTRIEQLARSSDIPAACGLMDQLELRFTQTRAELQAVLATA